MRRLGRIVVWIVASLALLVIGFLVYLFPFDGLERIVNDYLAQLGDQYNLEISLGRIEGSLNTDIYISDMHVDFRCDGETHRLAYATEISAGYSLAKLLRGEFHFDYVRFDSLRIRAERDSSGHWRLPSKSAGDVGDEPQLPTFSVDELVLRAGSAIYITPADTLRVDDIRLVTAIQGDRGTYSAEISHLSFDSDNQYYNMAAGRGRFTYADGLIAGQDIALVSGDTRLRVDGTLKTGQPMIGNATFAIDDLDIADISAHIGPNLSGVIDATGSVSLVGDHLGGSVDIAGDFLLFSFRNLHTDFRLADKRLSLDSLYGTILGECMVDGKGGIDFSASPNTYSLEADVRNFDLDKLIPGSFNSDLNGRIELAGESFRNKTLKLGLDVTLRESSFDIYPLHEASGQFVIFTDSIVFNDGFRVTYYENEFEVTGVVDYDSTLALRVSADLHNLDRYRGKLFIDQPGGRGYATADITGLTRDPDLSGNFRSDSIWLYDFYSPDFTAECSIERFLNNRSGIVDVEARGGSAWDIPFDSAVATIRVDSNLALLDDVWIGSEKAQTRVSGELDYFADPMQLRLDMFWLSLYDREFVNSSIIEIGIDSSGFDFQQLALVSHDADLSASGRIGYDESMDLQMRVQQMPIDPWMQFYDDSPQLDGFLSGEATVSGTFTTPQFRCSGTIDSLIYRGTYLGRLITGVAYDSRVLTVDSFLVLSDPGVYRAEGEFYADLSFTSRAIERMPDLPIDIRISATDSRFDLVSLLMPSVEQLDGQFYADVQLSGTPHDPHLEGVAYIKNARLKYFDLEQPIRTDSVGVTMQDNRIAIDHAEAYVVDHRKGDRRRFVQIEGEVVVKALDSLYYDLELSLGHSFPFTYELEDIQGRVEGDLYIEGDTPPTVSGDLTLLSTKYQVEFATPEQGSPIMAAMAAESQWDLDINIDILSNYWIKNEDIDAEFSGQVNIVRQAGNYTFLGEMELLRGKAYLFDKTFRLDPGGLVSFEGGDTFNPRLDIVGRTRITAVRPAEEGDEPATEQIELGIHITGTLDEPEINPVEESPFSREDLMPLIVANYFVSDTVQMSGQFEERLGGLISSQMSRIGSRQLSRLGVETFEIDPYHEGQIDPLHSRVTLGFYTVPNLYVYGRSAISGTEGQEVGFEYRFSRPLILEGRRDQEELYHLNLKLHWEF